MTKATSDATEARALLGRFAAAEPAAVAEVYRANVASVSRVVARTGGGSREEVEDLVQATFLEALRGAERFQGSTSVRAWLVGIAMNLTRMHRRSMGRERRRRALFDPSPDPAPSSEARFCDEEARARLLVAIDALPDLQREALVLCELEEMSAKEVSALLGAPPSTIWRRVHDARVTLRRLLAEADP
ncbi:MAG: sigma-70 family RNA polymerase sigma factor [Polyangiaceae bacterium]|nr:sigma-70 family RNA polymerase sigma factor [Polyangiaceae bacterium]